VKRLVPLGLVVAVVAACGADVSAPYSAKATAPCLAKQGWRVSRRAADVGIIGSTAARGGLRVWVAKRNQLTIAFGVNGRDAVQLAKAYRRLAPERVRRHIRDILDRQRNATLVWTVAPTALDLQTVERCLS
jgi:hypothetical protein